MATEGKQKALRNKTLSLTGQDTASLKKHLLSLADLKAGADITNQTINADLLKALKYIPNAFADLIIIDY